MKTHIKICGLQSAQDLDVCASVDIDAVGFNFWNQSKRYISPASAASLIKTVPDGIETVGIFVNATPNEVKEIVQHTGIHSIQLHGDENPTEFFNISADVVQVVRISDMNSLVNAQIAIGIKRLLLDSAVKEYGGMGESFDWSVINSAKAIFSVPTSVAGGLTPENVGSLIETTHPFGVDVASGVENESGAKNLQLVTEFVNAVREAENANV